MISVAKMRKDEMSGFFIRDEFFPFLERMIYDATLHAKKFSIILFDLDGFKKINDRYGHLFGDEVLKGVFGAMHLALRNQGYGFRYGGDEVIVIFPDKTSKDILNLVKRCREVISDCTFKIQAKSIRLTISSGAADFDSDGKTIDELIRKADSAVYISKRYGGNLITQAGRIRYIKFRNTLAVIAIVLAIASSFFILSRYTFREPIQNAVKQVRAIKIVTTADTIILKNGSIIRGNILQKMDDKILVSLGLEEGSAELILNNSEIAEIIYAPSSFFRTK